MKAAFAIQAGNAKVERAGEILYFRDAQRTLRPGGRNVPISFAARRSSARALPA